MTTQVKTITKEKLAKFVQKTNEYFTVKNVKYIVKAGEKNLEVYKVLGLNNLELTFTVI